MKQQPKRINGGAPVLLVDDHDDSRAALAQLLREEGMIVFEAGSGDEALRIFDELGGGIDLLISDMKMPGMDGLELMDKVMQRNSALNRSHRVKSIALTGYPKEYTESDTALYSFDEYIEKGGDVDKLLQVVRQLLDS